MNAPIKLRLIPLGGRRWSFNLEDSIPGWSHDRDICFGSEFIRWVEHSGQESLTALILCMSSNPKNKKPEYQVTLIRNRPLYGSHVDQFTILIPERGRQLCTKGAEKHINAHVEWLFK